MEKLLHLNHTCSSRCHPYLFLLYVGIASIVADVCWFCCQANGLFFRGQRIFEAGMEELMEKGMKNADQVLHLANSLNFIFSIWISCCFKTNKCFSGSSSWMLCWRLGIYNTLRWVCRIISQHYKSEMSQWWRLLRWCVIFFTYYALLKFDYGSGCQSQDWVSVRTNNLILE